MNKIHDNFNKKEYDFLCYSIYDVKSKSFVQYTLNKYPSYVNIKNENNEHIIVDIIKNYFDFIILEDKNNLKDVLYYQDIIDIFFRKQNFSLPNQDKIKIERIINDIANGKEYSSNTMFRIKEIQNKLNYNKDYYKEDLDNLNEIYDISYEFDNKVLNEIPYIINECKYHEKVNNSSNEFIITIDDEETLDMDDAFCISDLKNNNYLLKVYISNVSKIIKENSYIDLEASKRAETLYFSDSINPMIPFELSNNFLSLNSNGYKSVMEHSFEITPKGEIVNYKMSPNIIMPSKKLSYNFVNRISNLRIDDYILSKALYDLGYISYVLKNLNNTKTIYRELEDLKNIVNGVPLYKNEYSKRTKAEIIVEELMLLTGNYTGKFCRENDIPIIYRVNGMLDETIRQNIEKLKEVINDKDNEKYMNLIEEFILNSPSSIYSKNNKGHKALGYDAYVRVTSPLRRYADLVNQRILNDWIDGFNKEKYEKWDNKLDVIIDCLNQREQMNKDYVHNIEKIKHYIKR